MLLQFFTWNAETLPSLTHCARFPNSPLAAGRGCTIRLPPSPKARRQTRTPRTSRPSSRPTGRPPTKSSHLAPVPPLTPRTTPLSALSPSIPIYPLTRPARMLAGAFLYNATSPVPTPTTVATCRSICRVDAICGQQLLQEPPPVPCHPRRRFDSSSKTRSGEDHPTPIGSRSRWGHRGYVRDALDGSL